MIKKLPACLIIFAICSGSFKSPLAQDLEIVPQLGHTGSINCLALSPDGYYLASAGDDGYIKIWQSASGKLIMTLSAEARPVLSLVFHPDGKRLYSGDKNGWLITWDVPSGKQLKSIQGPIEGIYSLACSPDGTTLCLGSGYGAVQLWNVETMSPEAELQGIVRLVSNVAFSLDGKKLAFTMGDFNLKIWDLIHMVDVTAFSGHSGEIYDLVFSHSGRHIATGGLDGQLVLWDLAKGVAQQTWQVGAAIHAIQFSEDDHSIIIGAVDRGIQIFPIGHTDFEKQIPDYKKTVKALAMKNQRIFVGSEDGTIRTQPIDQSFVDSILGIHLGKTSGIFAGQNSNTLFFNQGPWLVAYDRVQGQIVQSFQATFNELNSLLMSPGKEYFAYLTPASTVSLINFNQKMEKQLDPGDLKFTCLAFNPIRPLFAAGARNGVIRIWDNQTVQLILELKPHDRAINSLLFDASGKYLVSAGRDKKIRVTNIDDPVDYREFVHEVFNFTSLCFTNANLSLVSGTDEGVLIELDFSSLRLRFQDSPHKRKIHLLNFFDDQLLVGSTDQTLTIWDWKNHVLQKRINFGSPGITSARILDANNVAVTADDGLIKFYDLKQGTLKTTFVLINKDTFFAWSSDNFFTGSSTGINSIQFRKNGLLEPAASYSKDHSVKNIDALLK